MKHECLLPFSLEKVYLTNIPYLDLAFPDPNLLRHQFLEYIPFEKIEEIYKEKDQLSKLSNLKLDQFISSADIYFNFPLNPRYFLQDLLCSMTRKINTKKGENLSII
jgi:hypothetical protein